MHIANPPKAPGDRNCRPFFHLPGNKKGRNRGYDLFFYFHVY